MDFTLDQLGALEAIARTGSFARAATELRRVPSAITHTVTTLEAALGVALFDREKRPRLTRDGEHVVELARGVLERARALERAAGVLSTGWESELRVVVDGSLPMDPLMTCLRRFADPSVPTVLRVDVEYQDGVMERFRSGADVALLHGLDFDGDERGLQLRALPPLEMLLIASADHPLARAAVTEASRAEHAELIVRDSSTRFESRSRPSFIGSRNVVYLSDFHSKRLALLAGAGYGWIPGHLVADVLASGALVVLEASPSRWTYQPQLATREGQGLGRGAQLFVDTLLAAADAPEG